MHRKKHVVDRNQVVLSLVSLAIFSLDRGDKVHGDGEDGIAHEANHTGHYKVNGQSSDTE